MTDTTLPAVSAGSVARLGRSCYALAIFAFGALHLVYGAFVTRVVPGASFGSPPAAAWAYGCGIVLVAAGIALLVEASVWRAALLLAALIGASFLVFHLPAAVRDVAWGGRWTAAGKALALCGGALAVAGTFAGGAHLPVWALPAARLFLAAFLVLCGIQHFIWTRIVVGLVPAWIPWPLFWAYFTGIALVAGGAGMLWRRTSRLAAAMSGGMILLWVFVLHAPRALADLRDANETTAVFEALATSGIAFVLAAGAPRRPAHPTSAGGAIGLGLDR